MPQFVIYKYDFKEGDKTLFSSKTGKSASEKFMTIAQNIGFYLIIALVIYANGSDILRLFS